jgi:SagB-type dehydrogenase family enzyme
VRDYQATGVLSPQELSLAELAELLALTNGVTGSLGGAVALRAAPSAGARYAGEIYVVAERVAQLAPGLYYFAVLDRSLVRLREGSLLGALAEATPQSEALDGAAFAVIVSNVFRRYTGRYANRGYRYALIDTGHIAENLRLAAASRGLGEMAFPRFRDASIDALLGVDGIEEASCALCAVGGRGTGTAAQAPVRRLVERDRPTALAPRGSVQRWHEATGLVPGEPGASPGLPPAAAAVSGALLPAVEDPGTSVAAAIRSRRSPLAFPPEAIAGEELGFVLEMARGIPALTRTPGVELFVAAHRVRGLAPGLYASDGRRLARRYDGAMADALVDACLGQEMVGSAAAALFMVARPDAAVAAAGPRSYRDLLVEAGAVGQRIYLAAEALGLRARNLAAFLDDELNELLGFGADGRAVLHLTAVGARG